VRWYERFLSKRRTVCEERLPANDSVSKRFLSLATRANSAATKNAVAAIRTPIRIRPSEVSIFQFLFEASLYSNHELQWKSKKLVRSVTKILFYVGTLN